MKAFCLNNISKVALATLKNDDVVVNDVNEADSILVRSFAMHEYELQDNILAVARCGAGVNNIPLEKYAAQGVVVFNTPGANANAVKELVLCGLLLASRDIIGGYKWIEENKDKEDIGKLAEKAKAKYAGNEIYGKKIAIIGLGVIGVLVANACVNLGMTVVGYDPYLSIQNAMRLNKHIKYVDKLDDACKDVDFVSVHAPLLDSTKGMISKEMIAKMKDGVILLNFARDKLIDEQALKVALEEGKVKKYVTDFANPTVMTYPNTICLPHLGASTEEAEDNCALMAIDELNDYLENGNITHSVNLPDAQAGVKQSKYRVCIIHKNIPGMIANFSSVITNISGNIATLVNKSKGEYAYTIIDVDKEVDVKTFLNLDGVIKVRVI